MKPRSFIRNLLFAAGWALGVLLLVVSVQFGFGWWSSLQGELGLARERLGRFQGWLAVEPQVVSRREELLGSLGGVGELDFSWIALQNLQEVAKAQGLVVTELRPAQVGSRGSLPILRLDAKIEGGLAQMSRFLHELPQVLPGIHLDNLQLLPEEGEKVQGILRLLLPFPGLRRGEA